MGDFNAPDVDWDTFTASSPYSIALCNFIFEFNLVQFVHPDPTHAKGNTLDLVLSTVDSKYPTDNLHETLEVQLKKDICDSRECMNIN